MDIMDANKAQGFSLIEVLVTIVVVSIGLLGLAGLQATALRNNQSAYFRTQATILANEYADILRTNRPQAEAERFGDPADDGVDFTTVNHGLSTTSGCETIAGCSAGDMADTALANWIESLENVLPSGVATVSRSGDVYDLTITWVDDRTDVDGDASTTKSFITSIRP